MGELDIGLEPLQGGLEHGNVDGGDGRQVPELEDRLLGGRSGVGPL